MWIFLVRHFSPHNHCKVIVWLFYSRAKGKDMSETFMKEKPVLPLLLSMAAPMVISMLVNALYNIVDSFFVAKISEDAMTALSLVFPVQNMVNAVSVGFGVGVNAVISYHMGAGEKERAEQAASHGMVLSLLHGVVMLAACLLAVPLFLRMFTGAENIVSLGIRYSRIVFLFSPVLCVSLVLEKIFQAVGRMKVTMYALLAGCGANILLDPVLIFGLGPFPALGMEGAALATGIGQVLTVIIYVLVNRCHPLPIKINKKDGNRDNGIVKRLYAIGIPATFNMALPSVLISALNGILAGFSGSYVVILGIYYKLQTFLYLPANGMLQGMRPLIGYNYGAGERERVRKIFLTTLSLNALIMVLGTVLCAVVPDALMKLYVSDAGTVLAGAQALRIISAGFLISAVSVTASGALEGLGKGIPSFLISLLRFVVVIIPIAWIFSRIWGAVGVWAAFGVAETITAVAACSIYRRAVSRP